MRGTPSCSTTSACFPIARKIWQQASADPTASPSGRACEVSTNRSCCAICRSTSSTLLCFFSTGCLASLLRPRQQFFHSRFFLLRAVQPEIQLRSAPQVQPLHQFMPDIFLRGFQSFQALVCIFVATLDVDPDLRGPAIIRNMNRCHAHQPNPRIGKLALDERFYLLAQRLANSPAMIFEPALLHDSGTSGKTHENIRKSARSVGSGWAIVDRFRGRALSTEVTMC